VPRQNTPIPGFDAGNLAKLNQALEDANSRVSRAVISKVAKIRQAQLHQHRINKFHLLVDKTTVLRHPLGAIPSAVQFSVIDGAGTVTVLRMTADRIYVKASANVRVNVVIQR
jgi:hypothetical protein